MNFIDPSSKQTLDLKIDRSWIQGFMKRFRIGTRAHTSNHRRGLAKEQ